ncbi:TlpA family protein disulfide reductase [Ehrlichia chaffeensis]|nr:thioredoxin family protein [Ehrlichia chaffeensis]
MPDTLLQIKEINSDKALSEMFTIKDSKVNILVIYTSWCSSCIKKLPEINKVIANNENIHPIIISLDENKNKLLSFLSKQGTLYFTPYNVPPNHMKKLLSHLTNKGITFDHHIPYIAVLYNGMNPITNINSVSQLKSTIKDIIEKYHVNQ